MGASGLRSSCASIARNSSLRRSVSRRASSARRRSSTSTTDPNQRVMAPAASRCGQRAGQLPAVGAVHAAEPILGFERLPGLAREIPQPQLVRDVIGMHERDVPVAEQRLDRRAAVLGGTRRQVVEAAIGRRAPQQRRRGLAEEPDLLFALPQLRLDAAALELGGGPASDELEDRARVLARRRRGDGRA